MIDTGSTESFSAAGGRAGQVASPTPGGFTSVNVEPDPDVARLPEAAPGEPAQVVLGLDALDGHRYLLDYGRGRVEVSRSGVVNSASASRLKMTRGEEGWTVDVRHAGTVFRAVVDTGATHLSLPRSAGIQTSWTASVDTPEGPVTSAFGWALVRVGASGDALRLVQREEPVYGLAGAGGKYELDLIGGYVTSFSPFGRTPESLVAEALGVVPRGLAFLKVGERPANDLVREAAALRPVASDLIRLRTLSAGWRRSPLRAPDGSVLVRRASEVPPPGVAIPGYYWQLDRAIGWAEVRD